MRTLRGAQTPRGREERAWRARALTGPASRARPRGSPHTGRARVTRGYVLARVIQADLGERRERDRLLE